MAYTPTYAIGDFDDMIFDLLGTVVNEVIVQSPTIVQLSVTALVIGLATVLIAGVFGIIKLPGLPKPGK